MDNKELLTDLYELLKKHKAYMRTDGDYISIIHEDTGEQIQSFYYFTDAEGLNCRISNMEKERGND